MQSETPARRQQHLSFAQAAQAARAIWPSRPITRGPARFVVDLGDEDLVVERGRDGLTARREAGLHTSQLSPSEVAALFARKAR